jgi:hypothetical protein
LIGVRTYVPRVSIGSLAICEALVRPVFEMAWAWNAPSKRCGVAVFVVKDREGAKDEFIDIPKADRVTGGEYPYLYVNVTYDLDLLPAEEFTAFVERFGLEQVYQTALPGVLFPAQA